MNDPTPNTVERVTLADLEAELTTVRHRLDQLEREIHQLSATGAQLSGDVRAMQDWAIAYGERLDALVGRLAAVDSAVAGVRGQVDRLVVGLLDRAKTESTEDRSRAAAVWARLINPPPSLLMALGLVAVILGQLDAGSLLAVVASSASRVVGAIPLPGDTAR